MVTFQVRSDVVLLPPVRSDAVPVGAGAQPVRVLRRGDDGGLGRQVYNE